MNNKATSTKQYDKEMLEKQKQHLINQSLNKSKNKKGNKITRDLDSFKWEVPVVKVVSKKKSQNEELGGSYLKYSQKSFQ